MQMFIQIIIILSLCFLSSASASSQDKISLDGTWKYNLIGAPASIPGEGTINLPSTLDVAHKSVYNPKSDNTTQLRREFSFNGEAAYSRKVEIPQSWKGKSIELFLERTKPTVVKIDGKTVGSNSRISSPQRYDLTKYLNPGTHKIEIVVNNSDSIPPIIARSSHAVSESTQTNWNGILGEIFLEAKNSFHIDGLILDDSDLPENAKADISFSERAPANLTLKGYIDGNPIVERHIKTGSSSMEITFPINASLWSARNPNLHDLSFEITGKDGHVIDRISYRTGFRNFTTSADEFLINGNPVFLRGTVNAAIFPLTGYAPTDLETWEKYFSTLQEYGLNHVRFHSWTPPEAAFEAADNLGFYILTELPIWGELDRDLKFHNRFLKEDLKGIMQQYSMHPSFVMLSPGNELWGDISLMGEYMKEAKFLNPRILSTYGSNLYLGMNGEIGGEDFLVSAKTGDDTDAKSVRGSVSFADSPSGGHFNSMYPNSNFTYADATSALNIPVISHEAGQYQSYPDFSEIEKYTGLLQPDNLEEFKKRAIEAGTFYKNKEYVNASGEWAAKLYKAEMEMAQRSPGIGGFELFGLQDYPGQGTALIGILDPFMDSKGFITPEKWRQSSSDLSLLAEFPKFSFSEEEVVEIPILTVNFTENPDTVGTISWTTGFSKGNIPAIPGTGVIENDAIYLKLPKVNAPQKMTLSLSTPKGEANNEYDFYVYPKKMQKVKDVHLTDNLMEALILLDQGEKVILCPDSLTVEKASLGPLFTPDFWNYRMYRSICDEMNLTPSPGTLGLFVNNSHPALSKFPSDTHTDWQWYPIVANSRPLIIDRLPKDFEPIIEVIDNVERNFRLSLLLECNVGKGKLIILSADKDKISQYPEGEWLLQSIKEYLSSKDCRPALTLNSEQVVNLVTKPSHARLIKELKNETYSKFQ